MAGYVIPLNSPESLERYISHGLYGTIVPNRTKRNDVLMTLADYVSMKNGDLVFFFRRRVIYGIGRMRSLHPGGPALGNWQDACLITPRPSPPYLWNRETLYADIPWVMTFVPQPAFFKAGVDMDEVLESDPGGIVRALRVFEGRSLMKLESPEAEFLANLILRANRDYLSSIPPEAVFPSQFDLFHTALAASNLGSHALDMDRLVSANVKRRRTGRREVTNEGLLHAWLVAKIARDAPEVLLFGRWHYLNNQEPASPPKPRSFMDSIDIFGYEVEHLGPSYPAIIAKHRVIEVKAGAQTLRPSTEGNVVDQTMKYVDWVAKNRAGGDYGRVEAFLIASDFSQELLEYSRTVAAKSYVLPWRPYLSRRWEGLHLLRYTVTTETPAIQLEQVDAVAPHP